MIHLFIQLCVYPNFSAPEGQYDQRVKVGGERGEFGDASVYLIMCLFSGPAAGAQLFCTRGAVRPEGQGGSFRRSTGLGFYFLIPPGKVKTLALFCPMLAQAAKAAEEQQRLSH